MVHFRKVYNTKKIGSHGKADTVIYRHCYMSAYYQIQKISLKGKLYNKTYGQLMVCFFWLSFGRVCHLY
ncbi:hypothetical protein BZ070_23570 [Salmonella enterica]|nr:hypothetical protein [Salmonella enterica]